MSEGRRAPSNVDEHIVYRPVGAPNQLRLASPKAPRRRAARDVYVFFDNDVKVHAPYDAAALARRLGLPSALPARPKSLDRRRFEPVRGATPDAGRAAPRSRARARPAAAQAGAKR